MKIRINNLKKKDFRKILEQLYLPWPTIICEMWDNINFLSIAES